MNEYELIRSLASHFPRGPHQRNALFECDAEIVLIEGKPWGMTMDEFTPEDDHFTAADPMRLGRNLAAATLSDLFAAGAIPRFFLSALALPRGVKSEFADGLAAGLSAALAEAGCALCGGDLGTADVWRFTGFAMGPVASARPLSRRVPAEPQALCVTGAFGDLNMAVLSGSPTPAIELRVAEAALIRAHATACIDTSGGFMDALWLMHEQSPGLRFAVDVDRLPLAPDARAFAARSGVPAEAVLLGGAGEYELLFTVPAAGLDAVRSELSAAGITVVGEVTEAASGIVLNMRGRERPLSGPPPCPRSAATTEEHALEVMRMARELFA
ncbi:MAG: hypothetical protein KBA51_04180 [Kiritimatiellae bacterium]|nr:hypothetical protein [Kiritimatiellia bacterium]